MRAIVKALAKEFSFSAKKLYCELDDCLIPNSTESNFLRDNDSIKLVYLPKENSKKSKKRTRQYSSSPSPPKKLAKKNSEKKLLKEKEEKSKKKEKKEKKTEQKEQVKKMEKKKKVETSEREEEKMVIKKAGESEESKRFLKNLQKTSSVPQIQIHAATKQKENPKNHSLSTVQADYLQQDTENVENNQYAPPNPPNANRKNRKGNKNNRNNQNQQEEAVEIVEHQEQTQEQTAATASIPTPAEDYSTFPLLQEMVAFLLFFNGKPKSQLFLTALINTERKHAYRLSNVRTGRELDASCFYLEGLLLYLLVISAF